MLIKCPDCGRDVSDQATACPNCGHPIAGNEAASRAEPAPARISVRIEPPEEQAPTSAPDPAPSRVRYGFPLAAAILYTLYTIFEIIFVRTQGLDSPEIFDNEITAVFLGGAGSSMYFAILATAALWAGIGGNRSWIFTTGMCIASVASVLWLMHFMFWLLPLILGWIGAAKMRVAEVRS